MRLCHRRRDAARRARSYRNTGLLRYPPATEHLQRNDRRTYAKHLGGGSRRSRYEPPLWLLASRGEAEQRRQGAERAAINAPMQGTAADIIKRAMISVDDWLGREKPDARMIMQVHDELVFEVREDQLEQLQQSVVSLMSSAAELNVELVVDTGSGPDWDTAH